MAGDVIKLQPITKDQFQAMTSQLTESYDVKYLNEITFLTESQLNPAIPANATNIEVKAYLDTLSGLDSVKAKDSLFYYNGTNTSGYATQLFHYDKYQVCTLLEKRILGIEKFIDALGYVRSGLKLSFQADMTINVGAGSLFVLSTNGTMIQEFAYAGGNSITFRYLKPDNTDEAGDITDVEPTQYYNSGVLTSLTANNDASFQKFYIKNDGTDFRMHRGVTNFATIDEASLQYHDEEVPEVPGYTFIGGILVQKNCTELDSTRKRDVFASKFGEI